MSLTQIQKAMEVSVIGGEYEPKDGDIASAILLSVLGFKVGDLVVHVSDQQRRVLRVIGAYLLPNSWAVVGVEDDTGTHWYPAYSIASARVDAFTNQENQGGKVGIYGANCRQLSVPGTAE